MSKPVSSYNIAINSSQHPPTYVPPPHANHGYQFAPAGLAEGTYTFTVDAHCPGITGYVYNNKTGTAPTITCSPTLSPQSPANTVTFTFKFTDTATGHLILSYADGSAHDPQVGNDGQTGG